MQTIKRAVQQYSTLVHPVIESYLKTTTGRDQELMTLFMGVRPAIFASGYVIRVKYPLHLERDVNIVIHKCEVPLCFMVFFKLEERTIEDGGFTIQHIADIFHNP